MKLNFWQWLGVALLAIGLILYIVKKNRNAERLPDQEPRPVPAATQPATTPAAR